MNHASVAAAITALAVLVTAPIALAKPPPIALAPPPQGELLAPGTISTGLQETTAALTPDSGTVYFTRSDANESDDTIMVSHRHGEQWTAPEVAPFSGVWHDSEPAISPDGNRLYFVSNRPPQPGAAPIVAERHGKHFPGTNLWYVDKTPAGWSEPKHVDGDLNRGAMIYNPSIAANGSVYFSARRDDSGDSYQIYRARWNGSSFDAPVRVDIVARDLEHNRMDPSIDPQERFLVYAGDEGDSLGSADIYISFHNTDGSWGKPVHLDAPINSDSLENAPVLGPRFGDLYVSSQRAAKVTYPKPRDSAASLAKLLSAAQNGARDIWRFDISDLLYKHGIGTRP